MNSKIQTTFGSELVPKNRVASTIDNRGINSRRKIGEKLIFLSSNKESNETSISWIMRKNAN